MEIQNIIIGVLLMTSIVTFFKTVWNKRKILIIQTQIEHLSENSKDLKTDVNSLRSETKEIHSDIKELIKKDAELELSTTKNVYKLTNQIKDSFKEMEDDNQELISNNVKMRNTIEELTYEMKETKDQLEKFKTTVKIQEDTIMKLQSKN